MTKRGRVVSRQCSERERQHENHRIGRPVVQLPVPSSTVAGSISPFVPPCCLGQKIDRD